MLFPKVATFFLIIIFLNCNFDVSFGQKCVNCKSRDFQSLQTCTCPSKQFCNLSTKKCNQCGECYNLYDKTLMNKKEEIKDILRKLIKRYEDELSELEKLIKTLNDSIHKNENQLKRLEKISNQLTKKVSTVAQNLNKLKNDVKMIEEKLATIGYLSDILKELNDIKNKMREILEVLKKLKFDSQNDLENLTKTLKNIDNNFPSIDIDKDALSLSLSVESDVELFETILSKFETENKNGSYDPNILWNTAWIEKDLLWLFTLLNNYDNVTVDVDMLLKNATNVRKEADQTRKKLEDLIKKHEELEQLLKKLKEEVAFYEELQKLIKKLNSATNEIKQMMQNIAQIKKTLNEELEKLRKEKEMFEEKEKQKRKFKLKMNGLLNEANELIQELEITKSVKPVNELLKEIEAMILETREIEKRISAHCLSKPS